MNRDVSRAMLATIETTLVGLSRGLEVGAPPIEMEAPLFSMTMSRNDPALLGGLDVSFGNETSVALPDDFTLLDQTESVLVMVSLTACALFWRQAITFEWA